MLEEKDLQAIAQVMDSKITEAEQRIKTTIKEEVAAAEDRIAKSTMVMTESYFDPKFNALAEGQLSIHEAMIPKSRVENLEDEVAFMKQIIKVMSRDIAELKKAQ